MQSLNESVLYGLLNQREMAYAKRSLNIHANLPTDKLDERIAVLNAAIDEQHKIIMRDGVKDQKAKIEEQK